MTSSLKLTPAQAATLAALRAALNDPSTEVQQMSNHGSAPVQYVRVAGVNGNAVNRLRSLGAISFDGHYLAKTGGHWFSGLAIHVS